MRPAVVMAVLLLAASPAWGQAKKKATSKKSGKTTELIFQLAVPNEVTLKSALVEMTRNGRIRYVALSDDGSVIGDQPHDGVWTGRYSGPFVQTMAVRLFVGTKKASVSAAYEGVVRMVDSRLDGMSWRLEKGRTGWVASPTAAAFPGRHGTVSQVLPTVAVIGWGLFVVALVALLAMGWRRGQDPKPPAQKPEA